MSVVPLHSSNRAFDGPRESGAEAIEESVIPGATLISSEQHAKATFDFP
jgi:hypothetical protein